MYRRCLPSRCVLVVTLAVLSMTVGSVAVLLPAATPPGALARASLVAAMAPGRPSSQSIPSPPVPDGPMAPATYRALASVISTAFTTGLDSEALHTVANGGDARASWLLADLLRFHQRGVEKDELVSAFTQLTGVEYPATRHPDFVWTFNYLMAWDLPAWEGYPELKRRIYTSVDDRWDPFFEEDHGVDWRMVTWGGVFADSRPFGDNGPCNCIAALDNLVTTDAARGDWYPDDRVVFGIVVNGEALALPRHQMEVHEMVNLTLGGRHLGIPYCTLCGSAQAYFTDNVQGVDRVVLRTSGLLSRSNKVMYDLTTKSVFDTFTGEAVTGPLGAGGVVLEQVSVVASTWLDWKRAHPDTQILAEDGGIGRAYLDDPLRGRDDQGPIFPIGDIDPRLPVQEKVVGVLSPSGTPVAFPVAATREALAGNTEIEFDELIVRLTDGVRVFSSEGAELPTHEAFWFAWSQFHPTTRIWTRLGLR